jgi:hypothetical protein
MFSAQSTRILDFPPKNALHTGSFYIMTPVLCQEACCFWVLLAALKAGTTETFSMNNVGCQPRIHGLKLEIGK